MEEKQKVIFSEEATQAIVDVSLYIEQRGFPETAERYVQRMINFGYSLAILPNKYPICRFPKFAKRNFRCAIFERTYTFIYKTISEKLIIYNVIHSKCLK